MADEYQQIFDSDPVVVFDMCVGQLREEVGQLAKKGRVKLGKANGQYVTDLTDTEIAEFVSKQFHTVEPVQVIDRNKEKDYVECIVATDWADEPNKMTRHRDRMRLFGDGGIETENMWLSDELDEDAWYGFLRDHNVAARA